MRFGILGLVGICLTLACGEDPSARAEFEQSVLPVLESRCAATVCHGVAPDAALRGEVVDWKSFVFEVDDGGRARDVEEAYAAAKRKIDTDERPEFSSLVQKPLPVESGGLPHYGGGNLTGVDDPAYSRFVSWISHESGGGEVSAPLDVLEQWFADHVQPVLVEAACMTGSCHGPSAGGIPYRLDPGVGGELSRTATRANYQASLRMLALGGYPRLSRLLRKSLPMSDGGIHHKGTNFDFYQGNPGAGADAIAEWACRERERATGAPCKTSGEAPISGFVFVRGPIAREDAFALDVFTRGSDLYLARVDGDSLEPSGEENLTEHLHSEPADIRDPAVSFDGNRVLFAMRTQASAGHELWELELSTRSARQLTFGTGTATDRDPTPGPDGNIWFVSTRHGNLADGGRELDAEIMSTNGSGELRRWTFTPHVERKPVFLQVGEEAGGELAFTALRQTIPSRARAHSFRFPPNLETEYHQHFGINSKPTSFFDLRELPDGRYVCVVSDLGEPWQVGRLGIIDRNFGPELDAGWPATASALPEYSPPLTVLEPEPSAARYRDPAPLPDGRLLVTRTLSSNTAETFESDIEVLTLGERLDGSGPTVLSRRVLVSGGLLGVTDPEPVFVRPPPHVAEAEHEIAADETHGILVHSGLPMIDCILGNLQPAGPKTIRDDLAFARLIEALPQSPATRRPIPAGETLHAVEGATSTSISLHGPNRILAELPLAADGSFQIQVPAGVPFRIQGLNQERMAVGTPHNRWFYALPGQVLAQGVSAATGMGRYNARCANCHGAPDGDGKKPLAFEDPDILTGASLTLSRYEKQNPRRPLPPLEGGEDTRISIDFRTDVQPFLTQKCASAGCHGKPSPAADLSLTAAPTLWFDDAYESLLAPNRNLIDADAGSAFQSFLLEKLLGRELGAQRTLTTAGSAHPLDDFGAPALDGDELLALVRWIDLGASYSGGAP